MDNVDYIYASNGSGEAPRLTVTSARAPGATTLAVDAVTNVPNKFIATSGTLNVTTGLLDPATVRVFRGHKSGSVLEIDGFAPGYVDAGNTVGQSVVIKPTTLWADFVADALDELSSAVEVNLDPTDGSFTTAAYNELAGNAIVKGSRRIPRIRVQASVTTLSPNIDNYNYERVTAQTTAILVDNPTGTPSDGEGLLIEITGTAARAITWGSNFESNSEYGLALPTTTVTTKTTFRTFVWSAARSKWLMAG